jgi:putative transcriptional regulator
LLALGYAGWGPGQLDSEIQENAWLNIDADNALVFDTDLDSKWDRALAKLGVNSALLSTEAGRA